MTAITNMPATFMVLGQRTPTVDFVAALRRTAALDMPTAEIWTITAETAAYMADVTGMNSRNRGQKRGEQKKMTADMLDDGWRMTGDSVKIGTDGSLLDGQNRLFSCVAAGTPFTTLVIIGIDPETFDAMDTGKGRSARDIFQIGNVPNYQLMAAAAAWAAKLASDSPMTDTTKHAHHDLLERYHREWSGLQVALTADLREVAKIEGNLGMLVAMNFMMQRVNARKAATFFHAWARDDYTDMKVQRHPVKMVKEALRARRSVVGGLHANDLPLLIATAWQAYLKGEALTEKAVKLVGIGIRYHNSAWPGFTK